MLDGKIDLGPPLRRGLIGLPIIPAVEHKAVIADEKLNPEEEPLYDPAGQVMRDLPLWRVQWAALPGTQVRSPPPSYIPDSALAAPLACLPAAAKLDHLPLRHP